MLLWNWAGRARLATSPLHKQYYSKQRPLRLSIIRHFLERAPRKQKATTTQPLYLTHLWCTELQCGFWSHGQGWHHCCSQGTLGAPARRSYCSKNWMTSKLLEIWRASLDLLCTYQVLKEVLLQRLFVQQGDEARIRMARPFCLKSLLGGWETSWSPDPWKYLPVQGSVCLVIQNCHSFKF